MDESKITRPQRTDDDGHGHISGGAEAGGEPYEYTPLPEPEPEPEPAEVGQDPLMGPMKLWTRLLTIYPGDYDDDLVVELNNVALEQTPASKARDINVYIATYHWYREPNEVWAYDALSYVWGSPENPSHVYVGEERRRIPITRNLDAAMRHIRYLNIPRIVWIDALCINQASTSEKSRQVGYMHEIYWSTNQVVVWLGPEADDSDHAMDVIEYVGRRVEINSATDEIRCVNDEDEDVWGGSRRLAQLPLDDRDWAAVHALMKRPWFERIWIRQEVSWADEEAAVHCGRVRVSFALFRRGIKRLTLRNEWPEATVVRGVFSPIYERLQNARFSIRGAKCTDPKDYIYGILGLLMESKDLAIKPDYSKSLEDAFEEIVLRHINHYGSVEILESCGKDATDREHSSSPGNINLPSWVPDWTSGIEKPFLLANVRRFVRISARRAYLENSVLRVVGLAKGIIHDFIDLEPRTRLPVEFSAFLRGIVPEDAAQIQYPGGGSLWDAYRITLCGNCFKDGAVPAYPHCFLSNEDSHVALEAFIHGEQPPQSPGSPPTWVDDTPEYLFYWTARQCWDTHRLFLTEDGLMGWAPKQARQGDHIAVMLGCETPMVLRPVSSPEDGLYQVVGPCYLQGFMHGESFLGPLPEGVRPVVHYEGQFNLPKIKFLNTISGETALQDPRSDAFPDPDQSWVWQEGNGKGGIRTVRLEVQEEDLRSAGVDIQYFDLV